MKYFFIGLLLFQPVEEIYNCNHPNTIGDNVHLICVWTDEDFIRLNNGNRVLRPKKKKDNFVKAHYRKKYWEDESNRAKAKKVH